MRTLQISFLAGLIAASSSQAGIIPGASVYVAVNNNYPFSADTTNSVFTSIPGTSVSLDLNIGSDAVSHGTASMGVLHMTESAHAHSDGTTTQQSTSLVVTEWQDILTFVPSDLTSDFRFRTGFWIHGSPSTTAGMYNLSTTNFRWQVDAFDDSSINRTTYQGQRVTRSNGFNEGTDYYDTSDPRGTYVSFDLPVYNYGGTYRTNIAVTFGAGASASTTFPGVADDASSFLDLGDTVLWGGIQVLDSNNNPVAGALSSATGFDWSVEQTEAPEPGTWMIAGLGLAGLGILRRR